MTRGPTPEENPFLQVPKGLCIEKVISVPYHADLVLFELLYYYDIRLTLFRIVKPEMLHYMITKDFCNIAFNFNN